MRYLKKNDNKRLEKNKNELLLEKKSNINIINIICENNKMEDNIEIIYNYIKVKYETKIENLIYNTLKEFYKNIYPYEYKEIYDILKNYNKKTIIKNECNICCEICNDEVEFNCKHKICIKCYLKNYIYSKEHNCPFCNNNLNFGLNKYYMHDDKYNNNLFGSKIIYILKKIIKEKKKYILYNNNEYVKNLMKKINNNKIIEIEDIKKNNMNEINILLLNYVEEASINNEIINMLKENEITKTKKINIDIYYYEDSKNML